MRIITRKQLSTLAMIAGLGISQTLLAEAPVTNLAAHSCAGCHGTDGYSLSPMPRIAGLNEKYFLQTMKEYKNGTRSSTIMGRIAKGYGDEELANIAQFFAKQAWKVPEQKTDAKLVEQGTKIHAEKCKSCHGEKGEMTNDMMPRLSGQWLRYLEIATAVYQDPNSKVPENPMIKMMAMQIKTLKDEEISALAHFYASQK